MRPMRRRTEAPRAEKGGARASHRAVGEPIAASRDGARRAAAGPARSTPRQTRPASRSRSTSPVATQPTSAAARRRSRLFPEGALVIADRAFDADRFRGAIEAPAAVPRTEGVRRTNRRCPEDTSRRRQPAPQELLQPHALPQSQRHRAHPLPAERLQARRNPIRPPRRNPPRRSLPRRSLPRSSPSPNVDRRSRTRHRRVPVVSRDPRLLRCQPPDTGGKNANSSTARTGGRQGGRYGTRGFTPLVPSLDQLTCDADGWPRDRAGPCRGGRGSQAREHPSAAGCPGRAGRSGWCRPSRGPRRHRRRRTGPS